MKIMRNILPGWGQRVHNGRLGGNRLGLTSFELVIALGVISLTIGLATLRAKNIFDDAFRIKAKGDLRAMAVAFEFYKMHHGGRLPNDLGHDFAKYELKWLSDVPKDPFRGSQDYYYLKSAQGHYILWSVGVGGDGKVLSFDEGNGIKVQGDIMCVTNYDPGRDVGCKVF